MLRVVGAIVGGLLLAFAIVLLTDHLFHLMSPNAGRPDPGDTEAMRTYVSRQSQGALAAIVAGWAIGVFVGAGFAARLARRGAWPGWIVTGLFLLATIGNFMMIPHPVWMILFSVILILAGGAAGVRPFGKPVSRA